MRLLASVIGIILIILAVIGSQHASASAALGAIMLEPQSGSSVNGWVHLNADGNDDTYVIVQATNLGALTTHAFALMTPDCAAVTQLLNPLMASIAGDGSSTSIATGKPDGTWWFGILADASPASAAVACGPTGGTTPVPSPAMPTATPTGGNKDVPVHQATTPPDAPGMNPNVTPTPLGS